MSGTSRCFARTFFQLGGPETLAAVAPLPYTQCIDSILAARHRAAGDPGFAGANFSAGSDVEKIRQSCRGIDGGPRVGRFAGRRVAAFAERAAAAGLAFPGKLRPDYLLPRSGGFRAQLLSVHRAHDQRRISAIHSIAAG
jgi:hypothetical protein